MYTTTHYNRGTGIDRDLGLVYRRERERWYRATRRAYQLAQRLVAAGTAEFDGRGWLVLCDTGRRVVLEEVDALPIATGSVPAGPPATRTP